MAIELAQGSYAKIKVTVPDVDLTQASQVYAFIYDDKGRVLKKFAKSADSVAANVYIPDVDDNESFFLEFFGEDTQKVQHTPKKFFCDVKEFITVDDEVQPMNNPSYKDENVIFILMPSITNGIEVPEQT